ncbi:MAG: DNA-3-methyladenine glycosylase [Spirochaetota bacterium]
MSEDQLQADVQFEGFCRRDPVVVARELLGCRLIRRLADGTELAVAIVETEAYRQDDPASHSHRGLTDRTRVMFGPPGRAYVYFIYGMYDCFNVVCGDEGDGAAVLVRAGEPLLGLETMWRLRWPDREPPARELRNLTSGPGKLCLAMGITREAHDGASLGGRRDAASGGEELVLAPPVGWGWDGRRVDDSNAPGGAGHGSGDQRARRVRLDASVPATPEAPRPADDDRAPGSKAPWGTQWPLGDEAVTRARRVGITKAAEHEWRFFVTGNPFVSRQG